jgi:hypothetical protein
MGNYHVHYYKKDNSDKFIMELLDSNNNKTIYPISRTISSMSMSENKTLLIVCCRTYLKFNNVKSFSINDSLFPNFKNDNAIIITADDCINYTPIIKRSK